MNISAYALIGLTSIVAVLAGGLAFAVLRVFAAAREVNKVRSDRGAETAFMAAAMEEALSRLRVREQEMTARAEASKRLSDEIIASAYTADGPRNAAYTTPPIDGPRIVAV